MNDQLLMFLVAISAAAIGAAVAAIIIAYADLRNLWK